MKPRRSVEEWRHAVFRHPTLKDATKVYLLLLAEHMRADRTVSVPRPTIARELGKSERRVDHRNQDAREAGFLDTVVRGQKHVTAVYVGLFPEPLSASKSSALRTTENRRAESGLSATPGGRTSSKRPAGAASSEVPNERRSEEAAPLKRSAQVRADVGALGNDASPRERTA